MITGRRATDWLAGPSSTPGDEKDRRGQDRRDADRRAPKRRFDPMFATLLINQLGPRDEVGFTAYEAARPSVRCGLKVHLRA